MTQQSMENILKSIQPNSLAHVYTKKGDKICIKDTEKTTACTVTASAEEGYLKITKTQKTSSQESFSYIYIDYSDISRVEENNSARSIQF